MLTSFRTVMVLAAVALVAAAGPASAALITPTAATSSTAGTDLYTVAHLIDNSGLTGPPYDQTTHAGSGSGNSWVTKNYNPDYYGAGPAPVLTLDLGGTYDLTRAVLWNYSVLGNAAKNVTVEFSTTGTGGGYLLRAASTRLSVSKGMRPMHCKSRAKLADIAWDSRS